MNPSDWVEVAKVVSAHGVSGLLKVKAYAGQHTVLTSCREVSVRPLVDAALFPKNPSKLTVFRAQAEFWLMGLEGVVNRDQAEQLKGATIWVRRSDFPVLEDGEYYWSDLVGCQVINREGLDFGVVLSVEAFGAHPLLNVSQPGQRSCRLIPFVARYVDHVDLGAKRMVVDWHADDFAS